MKRIYLAGGFGGHYKDRIRAGLRADVFLLHDPDDGVALPGYYVGQDLDAIRAADLVIAYQDDYPHVYGMAAEVGFAAAIGKPVIYVCEGERVDGFLAALSRAVFTNVEAACAFIARRYDA